MSLRIYKIYIFFVIFTLFFSSSCEERSHNAEQKGLLKSTVNNVFVIKDSKSSYFNKYKNIIEGLQKKYQDKLSESLFLKYFTELIPEIDRALDQSVIVVSSMYLSFDKTDSTRSHARWSLAYGINGLKERKNYLKGMDKGMSAYIEEIKKINNLKDPEDVYLNDFIFLNRNVLQRISFIIEDAEKFQSIFED